MAVYKRSYRGYEGPLTPRWSRFFILSRFAARGIFSSRIVTGLFVICFFFPLVMIAGLYLNHKLTLFCIEATQSGLSWAWEHLSFAEGILVGSFLWISFLALLALALSAWVRWKLIAGALLLGVMFFTSGFAAAFNAVLDTKKGSYLDPAALLTAIYGRFFGLSHVQAGIGTAGAIASYAVICGFCIFLLSRKVRAFEVVR